MTASLEDTIVAQITPQLKMVLDMMPDNQTRRKVIAALTSILEEMRGNYAND